MAGKGLGALEEWGIELKLMDIPCDAIVTNGRGDFVVIAGKDVVHVTMSSAALERLQEVVFTTGTYHER